MSPPALMQLFALGFNAPLKSGGIKGFILQIDDPGLADKFGLFSPPITVEAFRKHAELRIEATKWALRNIAEERALNR